MTAIAIDDEIKRNRKNRRFKNLRTQSSAFARLKKLPIYQDILHKIKMGYQFAVIARWIHKQGYCEDVSFEALKQQIAKCRDRMPPAELISVRMPRSFMMAEEQLKAGLDELSEMVKLYKLQLERIGIDYEKEKMIGKLFGGTGGEVKIALDILSTMAKLKQDLGLTEKNLGTLNVDTRVLAMTEERYGRASIQNTLSNPKSRQKILSIMTQIMEHPELGKVVPDVKNRLSEEEKTRALPVLASDDD
jgi:hypothetical protein